MNGQSMCRLDKIKEKRDEIRDIARKHNALRIFVFGSCARQEERPDSDVDFIADFNADASLFDHAGLEIDLADMLGCRVDVVNMRRLNVNDTFSRTVKPEMKRIC